MPEAGAGGGPGAARFLVAALLPGVPETAFAGPPSPSLPEEFGGGGGGGFFAAFAGPGSGRAAPTWDG